MAAAPDDAECACRIGQGTVNVSEFLVFDLGMEVMEMTTMPPQIDSIQTRGPGSIGRGLSDASPQCERSGLDI